MTCARALCAAALLAALPALAEARRFALVVGDAQGGVGTRPLRYAERDARRMHAILTRLGGVRPEDAMLLTSASASEVRAALSDLSARAEQAKARGDETVLLDYYSGHAKDGDLRLGDSRMPLTELREALRSSPADVRIGLLDSCQSGAIMRTKGVRAAPAFDVQQAQAALEGSAGAKHRSLAPLSLMRATAAALGSAPASTTWLTPRAAQTSG